MKIINLSDNRIFEANYPTDIVFLMMNATPLLLEKHTDEYMENVAARVKVWNGCEVRPLSAAMFLKDLEACGLIQILEDVQS